MADEKSKPGERPGDPCTIVIFGASGDLTRRKLLPALYNLRRYGLLRKDVAIIGVGRERDRSARTSSPSWARSSRSSRRRRSTTRSGRTWRSGSTTSASTSTSPKGTAGSADMLKDVESRHKTQGNVLFYLATPPNVLRADRQAVRRQGARRRNRALAPVHRREALRPRPRFRPHVEPRAAVGPGRSRRSTGSITTSARRRSRTSSRSASRTGSSSRSGTAATSSTSRSRSRRPWASKGAAVTTNRPACSGT